VYTERAAELNRNALSVWGIDPIEGPAVRNGEADASGSGAGGSLPAVVVATSLRDC